MNSLLIPDALRKDAGAPDLERAWFRQIFENLFDIAFGYRVAIRHDIPEVS
ncbi:MAG TPA: hypothetical protein VKC66_07325 [Xanthobacteraceae bacterium]|nr:hypothetical protein [Xanthobacteraceae bacterium]